MTRAVSTPRMVLARQRQAQATMLRASGWSYTAIAQSLGYASRASAHKAVNSLLEATEAQAGMAYRIMGHLRLERGLGAFARAIETQDFGQALRTMGRLLAETR